MTTKTVTEEYPSENAEVRVSYADGKIEEVEVKDQKIAGALRGKTTIKGKHLKVVKDLIENGFPE